MMHLFYLRERSGLSDSQNLKKKKILNQFLFQESFSIAQSFLRTLIGIAEIIDFHVVPMFYPSDIFIYL